MEKIKKGKTSLYSYFIRSFGIDPTSPEFAAILNKLTVQDPVGGEPSIGFSALFPENTDYNLCLLGENECWAILVVEAEKKIPASTLNKAVSEATLLYKRENDLPFISLERKAEIAEQVKSVLIGQAPVIYASTEVYIDLENSLLHVATSSVKQADKIISMLLDTLQIQSVPFSIQNSNPEYTYTDHIPLCIADENSKENVEYEAHAMSQDFLMWLWYISEEDVDPIELDIPTNGGEKVDCTVAVDGPLKFLNREGKSKEVSVQKGVPTLSAEAHEALRAGKKLDRCKIMMMLDGYDSKEGVDIDFSAPCGCMQIKIVMKAGGDDEQVCVSHIRSIAKVVFSFRELIAVFGEQMTTHSLERKMQEWVETRH